MCYPIMPDYKCSPGSEFCPGKIIFIKFYSFIIRKGNNDLPVSYRSNSF